MNKTDRPELVNFRNVDLVRQAIRNGKLSGEFYPVVYVIESASRCNLQCVMCPNPKMTPSNWGEINVELFQKVIIDIAPYCEFLMLYWMGEPFLHSSLPELLEIARSHIRGRIVLSSNMTRMDKTLAHSILSNVDILLCCIDRWDKTGFEKTRRGVSFETVVSNTESILAQRRTEDRCEVVVKALDISHGSDEYTEFQKYWSSKGGRPLLAWLNDWAGTMGKLRNAAKLPIPRQDDTRVPCVDLWFKLVMNWRGEVQMCCFDWNYSYQIGQYDKKGDWLAHTWQSDKIVELRQAHMNGEWAVNKLCAGCTTWGEEAELDAYVDFDDQSYFTIF